MPQPNVKIEHTTVINCPIEQVWNALIDTDDWKWNKWTRLEAELAPEKGLRGKLHASYEGNDEWKTFNFTFGEVDHRNKSLSWYGSVGPRGYLFHGYHTIKLEVIDKEQDSKTFSHYTRLVHTETFKGILPRLGLGLPYDKLQRNYLLMNEALKKFVEGRNDER